MATVSRPRSRTLSESEKEDKRQRDLEIEQARRGDSDSMISAGELKAEMESLMSLRRRSLSQPAALDPDLPSGTPGPSTAPAPSRPKLSINTSAPNDTTDLQKSPTAPSPAETGTLVRRKSSVSGKLPSDHPVPKSPTPSASSSVNLDVPLASSSSSADLFWLPASLHPELAPQEFKAFIKEQTKPENLARRVSAGSSFNGRGAYSSGRVERRKSTLRGEYKPTSDDGVPDVAQSEEATKKALSDGNRRKASRFLFEELTIDDLQRLEQLAARAEAEGRTDGEGEGEHLGRVLRRSLSLNPTDLAAAAVTATSESSSDAPLIVPPPGQILRRSARTKIRKAGITAEGPHRFGPSRRGRTASGSSQPGSIPEDEIDRSFDSIEDDENGRPRSRKTISSVSSSGDDHQFIEVVPVEWTDEPASIVLTPPPPETDSKAVQPSTEVEDTMPTPKPPEVIVMPPPPSMSVTEVPTSEPDRALPAAPSPSSPDYDFATHHQQQSSRPYYPAPTPPISTPSAVLEQPSMPAPAPPVPFEKPIKEKKSGWARLISRDDDKKRKGKGKEVSVSIDEGVPLSTSATATSTKEGFFGSLFGGSSKKRHEEATAQSAPMHHHHHQVQPIMPPAPPPPTASGYLGPDGRYRHFYRLPIHVERAVYRLSHIKLANPRRPLYEQVLISNLMFWYLSVINKPTQAAPAAPLPIPVPQPANETLIAQVMSPQQQLSSPQKRAGLSKPAPEGRRSPGRAEMPVRPAQYEAQQRQIQAEYAQQGTRPTPAAAVAEQPTQQQPQPSVPVPIMAYPLKQDSFEVTSRSSSISPPSQSHFPHAKRLSGDSVPSVQSDVGSPAPTPAQLAKAPLQLGSVAPRKRGDSLNSTSTGTATYSAPAFVSAAVNGVGAIGSSAMDTRSLASVPQQQHHHQDHQ